MRSLPFFILFITLFHFPVFASDEVVLQSGKIIIGEIVSTDGADPIRIKVQEGSIKATISYPADSVQSIARGVNQRARTIEGIRDSLQQLTTTPMVSPDFWWQTIHQLADIDADAEYRFATRQFIEFFPHHSAARKALGQERYEGKWMTQAEIKQAQGFIYYDKAWRTQDEVAQIEADKEQARQERIQHKAARKARRELLAESQRLARATQASRYFPAYNLNPHPGYGGGNTRYVVLPVYRPHTSYVRQYARYPLRSTSISGGGSGFNFQFQFGW